MTDQTVPDVTDDDRRLARKWAESIESATNSVEPTTNPWSDRALAAARVILRDVPAPSRPTLADMTLVERAACRWMQCDVRNAVVTHGVLANSHGGNTHVLDAEGQVWYLPPTDVTPRPDLPRMEWPSDQKAEDVPPVRVGDVIESADDPRVSALPAGTVLRDLGGEEVTRMGETPDTWDGVGYVPVTGDGTEFGPWTVARLPKKPATAPALPEGWRIADHEVYGRVVVTTETPNDAGNVYFVFPDADDEKGHYWHLCAPDRLTYLDADQEDDQ